MKMNDIEHDSLQTLLNDEAFFFCTKQIVHDLYVIKVILNAINQ